MHWSAGSPVAGPGLLAGPVGSPGYRVMWYLRWVTPGASITCVCSSVPPASAGPSKSRTPASRNAGDQVDIQLIEQAGGQVLPGGAAAAGHGHVPSVRR